MAHLIDPKTTPVYSEISAEVMTRDKFSSHSYDYKKVSQAEAYNNAGDNLTSVTFTRLARKASAEYARPNITDAYRDTLLQVKKIVTAGGRQEQQDAIRSFKEKASKLLASTDDPMIHAGLNDIVADLALSTRGDLKPEGYQYDKKSIREPTNRSVGKFGIWTSTNDALFPHEPSPNDIKQGFAVEDCFLMAPLIQMASSDPQKIKDSMRDNGDGTVTVRFFKNSAQADQPKEPVFVTVNKTVNKLAGKANVYASSALWVQMMEKAYIEYLTQYVQTVPGTLGKKYEHSYNDINRSYSDQVLNALGEKKVYKTASPMFGFPMDEEAYKPGAAKAEKYAAYEDKMFRFFEEHVNRKKESIIVGNSGYVEKNAVYAKSHGIRTGHAYAMMGVFQQDGKMYVQLRDPYAVFRSKYDANGKLDSVMKDLKDKKDPSLRAVHRLSDAVSLMGLKDGKTDVAQSVHGYAESMKIVKEDLVSILKNADIKPTAKEAVTRALDSVNNHIKNDAALNEQFTVLEKSDFPQNINTEPAVQKSQQRSATASIG